ncbi:MAG: BC1881 family protein [Fusobacterium ulcerans]|uniref:BC1881 family protein n=1 Tax=Fusobacterium ulcerans TaxID=861 RepID=UPI003A8A24D8
MNKELKDYTTKELTEELIRREGIATAYIDPYESFAVYIDGKVRIQETGPAILIVNQD